MRRLGVWLREGPARLYWLVMSLFLVNILVLLLGLQPPPLSLLVATVSVIFVLPHAWEKGGRAQ
jgi:hypothetical protein